MAPDTLFLIATAFLPLLYVPLLYIAYKQSKDADPAATAYKTHDIINRFDKILVVTLIGYMLYSIDDVPFIVISDGIIQSDLAILIAAAACPILLFIYLFFLYSLKFQDGFYESGLPLLKDCAKEIFRVTWTIPVCYLGMYLTFYFF